MRHISQAARKLSSTTLSTEAVKQLRATGFLDAEIALFAKATKPIDLTMTIWLRAMESRKEWIASMIALGWTKKVIRRKIFEFYSQEQSRTPWDFLVHVYNMPKQVKL